MVEPVSGIYIKQLVGDLSLMQRGVALDGHDHSCMSEQGLEEGGAIPPWCGF